MSEQSSLDVIMGKFLVEKRVGSQKDHGGGEVVRAAREGAVSSSSHLPRPCSVLHNVDMHTHAL